MLTHWRDSGNKVIQEIKMNDTDNDYYNNINNLFSWYDPCSKLKYQVHDVGLSFRGASEGTASHTGASFHFFLRSGGRLASNAFTISFWGSVSQVFEKKNAMLETFLSYEQSYKGMI